MANWADFKSTLTYLHTAEGSEGDTPFTRALLALAASRDTNTYATFDHEETHVIHEFATLGNKDGLKYIDIEIKRIVDVVEQLFVTGASQASILLDSQHEEPLDHLPGTVNVYFSKAGLTLLRAAQQFQPVHVRFYFDTELQVQEHKFTLSYTGVVLHQVPRNLLVTQPWVTNTHTYNGGFARALHSTEPAMEL